MKPVDEKTYSRFLALWHRYQRMVWLLSISYARGEEAVAYDYSQECALALLTFIDELGADEGSFAEFRWVLRLAHSTLRRCKRSQLIATLPLGDEIQCVDTTPDNKAREILEALMSHLDDDDRAFFSLIVDGYKLKELASAYGISESVAKKRYMYIKQKLNIINKKYHYYEP